MTALSPESLQLLDFLVSAKLSHCRVTRLKTFAMNARAKALRDEGLIRWGSFEPTELGMIKPIHPKRPGPPSMAERARRFEEQHNGAASPSKRKRGGRVAIPIAGLPTPIELHAEIIAFTKRGGISNQRFGLMVAGSPSWVPNLVRRKAIREDEVDRVRQLIATHKAAHPVDIKVNIAPRDPTSAPETPCLDWAEREQRKSARDRQTAAKRVRTEAMRCIEAGKPGRNHSVRSMMAEIKRQSADQARVGDSVEEAKLVIRKRGYPCFDAEVSLGKHGRGKFCVGRHVFTKDELLAYAKRLGAAG